MKVTPSAVFIICSALVCFVQCDKPSNTLTELSKPTNLTCCSERGSVIWKLQQLNSDGVSEQICSDQRCNKQGYSIDNSTPGCFHLIINSTPVDAAGLYQCNEVATDTVSGAYLIVFNYSCSDDTIANSDDLVEGDRVKFHCSMSWNGKWPFEIRWLNEHGIEMRKDVISDLNPFDSSYLEVNVSRPNFPRYTVQFGFLKNEITDPNVDKSCPSVNWSFPIRSVKYQPNDIKLSCPVEWCERPLGDTIDCSADGDPIPELHWLNWNNTKITSGSVLELKSLGTHIYKCVATNVIRGKNNEISKTVIVKVNPKLDTDGLQYAQAIFLNFLIATVIVAIIGFIWFVRRKIRAKKRVPREPPHMGQLRKEVETLPQHEALLPTKGISAEGGKPLSTPDEQKDHNVEINHKEYNHRMCSPNSMEDLGAHVSLRYGEVCQPNDSDISENEGSGPPSHPIRNRAHPESEVMLHQWSQISGVTGGETDDESTV